MNDEDAGLITGKHGRKKGSANSTEHLFWQALLGDLADELIEEAHREIDHAKATHQPL